ncbi:NUDIX domain-containing protein [Streptomyces lavendulocolor]|uniref:NUDIX domain-containing protein n=1 Tax=Streptomyces lavendulocolor TaxID=67316 RepID=UPI0033FF613D
MPAWTRAGGSGRRLRHPDWAYAGGSWQVLAGHCEAEAATACLVREAYEEAWLVIDPADAELVHTVHVQERRTDPPRIRLFFRARRWEGAPRLREPDKCVVTHVGSAGPAPARRGRAPASAPPARRPHRSACWHGELCGVG